MTTRAYSVANLEHGQLITWSGLLNGDDGTPLYLGTDYADRSVQVLGTLGTGGTVQIEGWRYLRHPDGLDGHRPFGCGFETSRRGGAVRLYPPPRFCW